MNKLFYPKLALDNINKNKNIYYPYIFSSSFVAAMFYLVCSLARNDGILNVAGAQQVSLLMHMGIVIVGIFVVIFLFYTNNFIMKRRTKEFGIYNILGMEKNHITVMIFFENLYVWSISLIFGLFFGILFDKLCYLVLSNMLGFDIKLGFYVSYQGIISDICLFTFIFFLLFVRAVKQIKVQSAVELLKSESAGEKEPKSKILVSVLGFIFLLAGYSFSFFMTDPMAIIMMFLFAAICVIIGTYLLLSAGSVTFLKGLKKNKKYYYNKRHFVSVSGMIYRMNQNAIGLGNICILSTMVLVMLSSTVCLWVGINDEMDKRYVDNIVVTVRGNGEEIDSSVRKTVTEALGINGIEPTKKNSYKNLNFTASYADGKFIFDTENGYTVNTKIITVVTIDDYNKMSGNNLALSKSEVLCFTERPFLDEDKIIIGDKEFTVKKKLNKWIGTGDASVSTASSVFIVVSDKEIFDIIDGLQAQAYGDLKSEAATYYGYSFSASPEQEQKSAEYIADHLSDYSWENRYTVKSKTGVTQSVKELYGGLLFLGIFLSILFVMAAIMIIYYKQISEGYDDCKRFEIMQKVGMDKNEVKMTIRSQILTVFFLPLIFASVHMIAAMPALTRILSVFGITDLGLFFGCTAVCILIFAMLYLAVYTFTAKIYYKIVRRK